MGKAEALVSDNNGKLFLGAFRPESASNIAVLAAKLGVANSTWVTFESTFSVGAFPPGFAVASFADTL